MPELDANLYLVGFMGTGKTTVGRGVAQRLGMAFLDSDHEIEVRAGGRVTEIFEARGEAAFRKMEREFIEGGHPTHGCVVACGGGLIIPEGMLDAVTSRGVVVCLHASLETIMERVPRNKNRPLLAEDDAAERAAELFAIREPIYRRAGTAVLTEGRTLTDIIQHVMRVYHREAREWARTHARGRE